MVVHHFPARLRDDVQAQLQLLQHAHLVDRQVMPQVTKNALQCQLHRVAGARDYSPLGANRKRISTPYARGLLAHFVCP